MKNKLIPLALCLSISLASNADDFSLASRNIVDGRSLTEREVFNGFGCKGKNISPELSWSNAPAGTKSFAVTVYDPDAPTGSGWWHWTVVNIPLSIKSLPSGVAHLPAGAIQGRTDYGQSKYGGVCPPPGDKPHHYQFTVWALKVEKLSLDAQASGALVGYMLNANVLAKATITSTYGR
ncbi:YbhB/YbcL family Raf kinase inhibitor-like protein [Pseudomonas sp. T1.Ur]|uniref:YbhB/YbcL family Raf kinase inhibitor-like protein n=1 Tax=Pseudomonas sp. T1.Ur TaxID=2928704 RepID=UPI00201E7466|nr:YbhB/YbcL family Raf kinase inhibitor-like protein [Pseudomonas sp. T1.Ur]MCL6702846.1 YbhB/YbcL family Raf kinase inhibitor-like protein [Pseudomonas sp. T1.Ur]